jgi:hypothetical protein
MLTISFFFTLSLLLHPSFFFLSYILLYILIPLAQFPISNQIRHATLSANVLTTLVHPIPDWPRGRRLFLFFSCFMENYSIRKPYLDPERTYRVCERRCHHVSGVVLSTTDVLGAKIRVLSSAISVCCLSTCNNTRPARREAVNFDIKLFQNLSPHARSC